MIISPMMHLHMHFSIDVSKSLKGSVGIFLPCLISGVHVEGIDGAGWEVHRPRGLVHRTPVQLPQVSLDGEFVKPNLRLKFLIEMFDGNHIALLKSTLLRDDHGPQKGL